MAAITDMEFMHNVNKDEPTPSNIHLLDMNDDCLLNIFKYLSPHNLLSVALTCTRLQVLARTSYKSNKAHPCVDLTTMIGTRLPKPQN